jgi:hypothetical protein
VNASKIIGLIVVAITLFFVMTDPAAAAAIATTVLGALRDGAEAVITFLRNLFN